ncbi:MAG: ferrous iron transport protein A [Deltaproteobacteria bacterium]|nr:ferrous iron transport protein A [Deltaproteobacteria bacterium]
MEAKKISNAYSENDTGHPLPLTMTVPGQSVTIVSINGGRGMKMRLYSMGLTPGVRLRVLSNGAPGPFLLAVRDFKVALGYGMAQKIMVR